MKRNVDIVRTSKFAVLEVYSGAGATAAALLTSRELNKAKGRNGKS
jgi:hypothetical protein